MSTDRLLLAFTRAIDKIGNDHQAFHSEFQDQLRWLVCEDTLLAMRAKNIVRVEGISADGEYQWALA